MTDKEFFAFAYDEYKADLALANTLYQRAGILLTAQVILGGAAVSLIRIDLLQQCLDHLDVFLLQISSATLVLCLLACITSLIASAFPRDYPKLNKVFFWQQWREQYWATLVADDPNDEPRNRRCLATATREALLSMLAEAQGMTAYINQRRLRAFQWGVRFLALAVAALVVQSIFALVLKLKGI